MLQKWVTYEMLQGLVGTPWSTGVSLEKVLQKKASMMQEGTQWRNAVISKHYISSTLNRISQYTPDYVETNKPSKLVQLRSQQTLDSIYWP